MSWGYLEDASGAKGHADRICIPKTNPNAWQSSPMRRANKRLSPSPVAAAGSLADASRSADG